MDIIKLIKEIKQKIFTLLYALKDHDTPWYAKLVAGFTVAYAFSPIDLIPDFIPILGYLDDAVILPLLVWLCWRLIPKAVLARCESLAVAAPQGDQPHKWYYALSILLLWAMVIGLIYWIIR